MYATIFGEAALCAASTLELSVPRTATPAGLDLSGVDDATRAGIVGLLEADAGTADEPIPADTYFGAKALHRLGQSAALARELGRDDLAERFAEPLVAGLDEWLDPEGCAERRERCFVYDPELHGVVGLPSSFGSEEFNDHHFHWGYLIAAAALAVEGDPALADRYDPMVDTLIADIAGADGEAFPETRVFDPYWGHSWASGFSPFADGNNQESTSEAANAWYAISRWGGLTGDAGQQARGDWLLAAEAASARALWTAPDPASLADGYAHPVVSLTWGGKRDWATWFSDDPAAILAIQLIPMSPVAPGALPDDPEVIRASLAGIPTDGAFGDYLLMYAALAGDVPDDPVATARDLPDEAIDDGDSRAYLAAFLAAAAAG
nr:glycosyl hydrolase [Agromyces seonyuensis]